MTPTESPDTELEFLEDMEREEPQERPSKLTALIVLSILLLALALFLIVRAVFSYKDARAEYDAIRSGAVSERTGAYAEDLPAATFTPGEGHHIEGADLQVDFNALKARNEEVVAWLDVPALSISYPVLQGKDNDYYLDHTLEGTINANGAIFMESANLPDFSHGNTFIYGHNSADGAMFGRLHEFGTNPALREAHPYFFVYLPDGRVLKYAIYSYYYAETGSRSFVYFSDEASYDYYVGLTIGLSDEDIEADFSGRGNIVTLSTCYGGTGTVYRYLVHGVLTEEGKAD